MCHMRYFLNMATRTTVNVSLTPELGAFLQSRVKSGRYQTTSEVVREALRLLQYQEKEREEGLKQLKAKLQRGAAEADRRAHDVVRDLLLGLDVDEAQPIGYRPSDEEVPPERLLLA